MKTQLELAREHVNEARAELFKMDASPPRSAWRALQYTVGRLAESVDELTRHAEERDAEAQLAQKETPALNDEPGSALVEAAGA